MTQTAASLSLREVAVRYGLNVMEIREDLLLAGSPDRTESCYVVEDDRHELFILETIQRHTRPHKQRIIDALDELSSLGIHPNGSLVAYSALSENQPYEIWAMENFLPDEKTESKGGQK